MHQSMLCTINSSLIWVSVLCLCSCQRPAVRAWSGEAGRFRSGRSADRHADQKGNLRGNAVLDGARGHPAVRLRFKGQTPVDLTTDTFVVRVHPFKPLSCGLFLFENQTERTRWQLHSCTGRRNSSGLFLCFIFKTQSPLYFYAKSVCSEVKLNCHFKGDE